MAIFNSYVSLPEGEPCSLPIERQWGMFNSHQALRFTALFVQTTGGAVIVPNPFMSQLKSIKIRQDIMNFYHILIYSFNFPLNFYVTPPIFSSPIVHPQ